VKIRETKQVKMSSFSHMDGKVAGSFRVFVYLSVGKCVSSLFGAGFLSALEVRHV